MKITKKQLDSLIRTVLSESWDRELNPHAKKMSFEDFKKAYFKGESVSDKVAREFWSDFRWAHVGSLKSYKEATSDLHERVERPSRHPSFEPDKKSMSSDELRAHLAAAREKKMRNDAKRKRAAVKDELRALKEADLHEFIFGAKSKVKDALKRLSTAQGSDQDYQLVFKHLVSLQTKKSTPTPGSEKDAGISYEKHTKKFLDALVGAAKQGNTRGMLVADGLKFRLLDFLEGHREGL